MKKVAIVGFGFMGKTHFGAWKKVRGAKVVAICDQCLSQLTAKVVGNIKGAADNSAVPKSVKVYENFDEMLKAGDIDIVDITLPTMLHAETVIKALQSGRHVMCEKPMALNVKDCDRMIAAAKAAKRVLMVAHVVRFQPANLYLRKLIESKRYGKVIAADFTRFIAPPKWSPKGADWFFDEKKSGGVFLDAHIHDVDLIVSLFGKPDRVSAEIHRTAKGYPDHVSAAFRYGDALVTSDGSFSASASLVHDKAYRVFFEQATVFFGPRYTPELTVYPEKGKPFSPKLKSGVEAYADELKYFLGAVEKRNDGSFLTAESARDSVALALKERKIAR